MAHRTVVILYNDDSREWIADPELGRKIAQAAAIKATVSGARNYGSGT